MAAVERIWRLLGNRQAADLLLWVVITAPVLLSNEMPAGSRLSLTAVRLVDVIVLALAVVVARRLPLFAAVLPASVAVATPKIKPPKMITGMPSAISDSTAARHRLRHEKRVPACRCMRLAV